MQLDQTIGAIRYFHRQRVFAMEQRKRSDLALGSFLRTVMGWSLALPTDERNAIRDRANAIMEIAEKVAKEETKPEEKRKPVPGADDPDVLEWADVIGASLKARAPFDAVEKKAEKEMRRLAMSLPVWERFGAGIRGFGELSLAIIVAEAGDLALYPKKGHLWKRMGVAQIDGVRQGSLPKTAPKEAWIAHGYNRQRRSRMFTIGDTLVKAQGPYREVYLARKAYEIAKAQEAGLTVAPSAKIPAKRAIEFISDGHIHRKAQRYMEQRLLRDLWQAWRDEGEASGTVAEAA